MPQRVAKAVRPICLALLLAWPGAARAEVLCARDEVAQVVAGEVRRRNHYARLDTRSVLEWSTDDPNTVRCTAQALVEAPYAANGVAYRELHRYSVTVSGNRFTVSFADR